MGKNYKLYVILPVLIILNSCNNGSLGNNSSNGGG